MEKEELTPCLCGGGAKMAVMEIDLSDGPGGTYFFVTCEACGLQGSAADTETEARTAWENLITRKTQKRYADLAKRRLREFTSIAYEVKQLEEQIQRMDGAIYAPKIPGLTGLPRGSGLSDPTGENAVNKTHLLELYKAKKEQLDGELCKIELSLADLDSLERRLIRHKYFEGQKWEAVCMAIDRSWAQTHRIHSAALIKLGEIEKAKPQE